MRTALHRSSRPLSGSLGLLGLETIVEGIETKGIERSTGVGLHTGAGLLLRPSLASKQASALLQRQIDNQKVSISSSWHPILETTIRNRVAYNKTGIEGKGVYEYSDTKAKAEMVKLTKEVLKLADTHNFLQS